MGRLLRRNKCNLKSSKPWLKLGVGWLVRSNALTAKQKLRCDTWRSHFNNAREATSEFDARRCNFRNKPSRFKLEVEGTNKLKVNEEANKGIWNFNQSLWDPFEIVAVSKRLEPGLVLDYDFDDLQNLNEQLRVFKKRKESKNSLRNLFNMMSFRRFNDKARISD